MAKNFVSNNDESVPMFNKPVLDFFSRVHFSVPLFIFLPVIIFFSYRSVVLLQFSALTIAAMAILGLMVWTFTEYNLHRFVFHWRPPGKLGQKIHFMFHGVHHDYPRDSYRLVMVPPISVPLAILFYFSFQFLSGKLLGNANLVAPFFIGFVIGYLFYDMTHYALHHVNFKSKFWIELKQHHMIHHYQDPDNGFGVSTKFWDLIYRTTFRRKQSVPEEVSKATLT